MNIKVVYQSATQNTKKVAQAIAKELNVTAYNINEDLDLNNTDILFLGGGNYMGKASKKVTNFISKIQSSNIKKIYLFGTYGGQTNSIEKLHQQFKDYKLPIMDEWFACKGRAWFFINAKSPTTSDLEQASKFARKVIEK